MSRFRDFVAERELGGPLGSGAHRRGLFLRSPDQQHRGSYRLRRSQLSADLCDTSADSCFDEDVVSDADEQVEYGAFFVNGGPGRVEARLSAGDLSAPVRVTECWSPGLQRTSLQIGAQGASGATMVETMENAGCAAPADQSARALGLPTLGDVDSPLRAAMSCAAERGLSACD